MRPWRTASAASPPSTSANASSRSTSSPRWRRPASRPGRLPFSLRILLENLLRTEDGKHGRGSGHPRAGQLGPEGRARATRSRSARARAAAGLHRRPGGRRSRGDARRMKALGGDPTRINPLQPAELVIDHSVQVDEFGNADALLAERADRVRAQPGALRVPALGPDGVPELRGRAARHRHRPPGEPRVPGARRLHGADSQGRQRRPGLSRTRWSAPTRTRRWSTAWACSAGASAASRPRRRCSASRCRC